MTEPSGRVLHLAHVDEWNQTLLSGWFDRSTRGRGPAAPGDLPVARQPDPG